MPKMDSLLDRRPEGPEKIASFGAMFFVLRFLVANLIQCGIIKKPLLVAISPAPAIGQ